jgi:hypothetical protein
MDKPMTKDELAAVAAAAGLARLSDKHLAQLEKSVASADELSRRLPKDFDWTDELALTFRLRPPAGERP